MSDSRFIRRRRSSMPILASDEMVAAARLNLTDPNGMMQSAARNTFSRGLGCKPWEWYDKIGEVHFAVNRHARVAASARLGVYVLNAEGVPGDLATNDAALEVSQLLTSPRGGQRELIHRYIQLSKVPGFMHLMRVQDTDGMDGLMFRSAEEVTVTGASDRGSKAKVEITGLPRGASASAFGGPTTDGYSIEVDPASLLGDVWNPHPRFYDAPDSALLALEAECYQLHLLSMTNQGRILSRLAMSGILYLPDSVLNISSASTVVATHDGAAMANPALASLIKSFVANLSDPGSARSVAPIIASGPAADSQAMRMIDTGGALFETDMKLREELLGRIITGLDSSRSGVTGREGMNHFSSWSEDASDMKENIRPELEQLCFVLTKFVLWPELRAAGMSDEEMARHVIWFDMSDAESHINKADNARQLVDRAGVALKTARRAAGFNEDDRPSDEEYVRQVGFIMRDPYLATYGLDLAIEWDRVTGNTQPGPLPSEQGDEPPSAPGVGDPGSPPDSNERSDRRNNESPS